jgi:hypothetical protein
METYQKQQDLEYPVLHEEIQAAVEQHKLDIAKRKDLSPAEKAQRFADNMPVEPTIDDCFADNFAFA